MLTDTCGGPVVSLYREETRAVSKLGVSYSGRHFKNGIKLAAFSHARNQTDKKALAEVA